MLQGEETKTSLEMMESEDVEGVLGTKYLCRQQLQLDRLSGWPRAPLPPGGLKSRLAHPHPPAPSVYSRAAELRHEYAEVFLRFKTKLRDQSTESIDRTEKL